MAKIKVIHDPIGETLAIFFHEPSKNQICELTDDEVILIRDEQSGELLGFEILHYKLNPGQSLTIESNCSNKKML